MERCFVGISCVSVVAPFLCVRIGRGVGMRCIRRHAQVLKCVRLLTIRPECTVDPLRFPLGYCALDGTESIHTVYALLKAGHFVSSQNKVETVHRVYQGARSLAHSEYPCVTVGDLVGSQLREKEVTSRILIPRQFWTLDDFNDPEVNQSFGVQNYYFDNYKWSQVLWRRFVAFVEEYFPVSEHTHLLYDEYVDLIRSFAVFENGVRAAPAVPQNVRLHPPFGVLPPSKHSLEPVLLLKRWVMSFKGLLRLNRALVVNAGSGVTVFALKSCKVPMVRGVDPRPRAVAACRKDANLHWMLSDVSFQVAELFPPARDNTPSKRSFSRNEQYDLIVFYPDEEVVSQFSEESHSYAPGQVGFAGQLEEFFDNVLAHLSDTGVVAICCTNLKSILHPDKPHPIEYEVKVNRRFVILDYFDSPLRYKSQFRTRIGEPKIRRNGLLFEKMRSELWVLHKTESMEHFGFIHGIPGAKPPAYTRTWGENALMTRRRKAFRDHAEVMEGDWSEYKGRLLSMLQEQIDEPEDDVAETVRMALDPTFPAVLAQRAQKRIAESLHEKLEFQQQVSEGFPDASPREVFDRTHGVPSP